MSKHLDRLTEITRIAERDGPEAERMELLAYASSLAAQLESERAKVAELSALVQQTAGCHHSWVVRGNAAEQKLRAAEGVIAAAKTWARDMADIEARGLPPRSWDVPLVEAIAAFDAINPDGSTGGPNSSK